MKITKCRDCGGRLKKLGDENYPDCFFCVECGETHLSGFHGEAVGAIPFRKRRGKATSDRRSLGKTRCYCGGTLKSLKRCARMGCNDKFSVSTVEKHTTTTDLSVLNLGR